MGCAFRPVKERDLDMLERFDVDPAISEPFEWPGLRNHRARRHQWEQDAYLGDDDSMLVA